MAHHRDKTSGAMANRCWCLITSFCCRIFCLIIYLLLLFVYCSLVCCCYCCCFSCFLCFLWLPSFKQALHNKLPSHLGGNYSRIVFQPKCYSRNKAWGTSDNKSKNWYFFPHCPQCAYHGPHQRLDHNYIGCKWRRDSSSCLCPVWSIHTRCSFLVSTRKYLSNIDNQQTLKRQKKTEHKQLEIQCNSVAFNRPFYNYGWKRGWGGPCFDTTISSFFQQVLFKYNFHNKTKEVCITTLLCSKVQQALHCT